MDNRTDNDIKNHWNSCLKKRLSRKGIDPMTHEPIINNLTVTITNEECGSSSITTFSPTSSPSGSACLLNKLATGISSRQHDLDKIKSILLEPRIASSDQDEKEEVKRDHTIGGGEEGDDFLIWDDEEVRRFMESDEMEYGTTPSPNQSTSSDQDRAGPSELQSFSESLKSRLNAVSMRYHILYLARGGGREGSVGYKESISKNTRSWKDRFFSRSTSMADIGSEVKREVSAGIATVSRLMERLETRENGTRPGTESVSENNTNAELNNEHSRRSEAGDAHSLNERGVKGTCAAASGSS
ncbi:hypothetical protein YC2023_103698 [Brassica napus]